MHATRRLAGRLPIVVLLLSLMASRDCLGAEDHAGTAQVRAILGRAQFARGNEPFGPLGPGMVLRAGDIVRTATGSAVDLYLGEVPGTVRLTASATLVLEKLSNAGPKAATNFEVQLQLQVGELLGLARPVPPESRFEIKVGNGLAQVIKGRFRVNARGYFVLVDGKALFAHLPTGGEPVAYTLTAPPAVYFSPGAGVQPAPRDLAREVVNQMRSKLPRR